MPATSSLDQELSTGKVPRFKAYFYGKHKDMEARKMRKNIKNNMITRIMAIGLATVVLATSVPPTVFADDEETVSVESSDSSSDSSSESSSDSSESVSCESEAPAVEAAPEVATEAAPEVASEVAEAAAEESTFVAEILIIDNNIAPEAEAVAAAPEATVEGQEVAEAETPAAPEKSLVEIASESIDNLEDKTETVKSTEQKSSDEADSAVENAEVANTSKSKKEAYQAKDDAVADITAAEADLEKVNAAYEEAVVAKEQAESDVAAAEAEYNAAVEQLNEARRTASQNLTAAQAQQNDAESRVRTAESAIKTAKEEKAKLEKIELQYHTMMDFYYRQFIQINADYKDTAVTNEDGTLNVVESLKNVKKIDGSEKYINELAAAPSSKNSSKGNELFELGRGLMADLIVYMLESDGKTNVTIPTFKEGDTVPNGMTKKNADEKTDGESVQIWKNESGKNSDNKTRNGRDNHITVTFDYIENGETKHGSLDFNYVFKSSEPQFGNKTDIENGPIYLAIIQKENGEWTEKRAESDNNLDNFDTLTKTIAAYKEKIEEAEKEKKQAEEDVAAAKEKVDQYEEELRQLNNTKIDDSKVKELKERLAEAVEDLSEAEEAKEELEVKVEEARKIVDAIDLSRFRTNDDSDYEESSDDTDPVVPVYPIPTIAEIPELIPTIPTTLPTVIASFPTSGVLGVRTVASNGSDNVVSDVTKKPVAVKEINLGGDVIGKENGKKLVKIDNNIVPLAAAPGVVEANGFNWWWILLLVGTAVVIFVVVYKKRKEEDEAKAVNK